VENGVFQSEYSFGQMDLSGMQNAGMKSRNWAEGHILAFLSLQVEI